MNRTEQQELIPLCAPEIGGNEWAYIKDCLDTGWVSSVGHYVCRFEQEVADQIGLKQAVATVNGTSALHIALLVAGIQPDDEVLVSSLTFVAPANAIRYVGAWPVFIDAETRHWQMDPQEVSSFLHQDCRWNGHKLVNKRTGRNVTAILPVHILGHPVDMEPIVDLARRFGLRVIEDATEGLGAKYRGRSLGAIGDIGCFSFNGNKIITTGGGGMMVTDNAEWASKAKYLTTQAKDNGSEYIHRAIGFNYRLTNLQAAIGCAQLEQLDRFIAAKRQIAARYRQGLEGTLGLHLPVEATWAFSTYWMYTLLLGQNNGSGASRKALELLSAAGIQARPLWQPLHLSPAHDGHGGPPCPNAEALYERAISLPCSAGLPPKVQDRVISSLRKICGQLVPST